MPAPGALTVPGRSWSKRSKLRPFKRQVIDRLVADGSAQGGIGGIDRGDFSGHRDGLSLLAGLHHQVHANVLPHFHQHAAVFHSLNPLASARTV